MAVMLGLPPDGGGQSPPTFAQKSFSDLFTTAATKSSSSIKPLTMYKGEPALILNKDDIVAASSRFRLALVGKFSKNRPTLEEIRKFFTSLDLRSSVKVGLLDSRHVLIQCFVEDDYQRLWTRGVWYILGSAMRVFKWTPNFHVDRESSLVPVWLSLSHLPLSFYDKSTLFSIASSCGVPLRLDAATTQLNRPNVARILTEVDLMKPLPSRIWLGFDKVNGFWQEIEFENLPKYCCHCFKLGHDEAACHVKNPNLKHVVVENVKKDSVKMDKGKGKEIWVPKNHEMAVVGQALDGPEASCIRNIETRVLYNIVSDAQNNIETQVVQVSDSHSKEVFNVDKLGNPQICVQTFGDIFMRIKEEEEKVRMLEESEDADA